MSRGAHYIKVQKLLTTFCLKQGVKIYMVKIRIFTDGGSFKKDNGKFRAVSSIRIFRDYELIDGGAEEEIHEDKTNNYAEIYSIKKALERTVSYLKTIGPCKYEVELYSDSKLCIDSLTKWIYNWIKTSKEGIFYNSNGDKVANQEVIKEAFKLVFKLKKYGSIKLWHINSHKPKSKLKELHKKFMKSNKCIITYEDFVFAYWKNKECDEAVKTAHSAYLIKNNIA
jgi:ribonuclease HI